MDNALLQAFIQLISHKTGLQIRPEDRTNLHQKIDVRVRALRLPSAVQYYQLLDLARHPDAGVSREPRWEAAQQEWQALIQLLTITESYFFRDQGQFRLLRELILPELIQQNAQRRSLRIWSAGCSTGEEVYSLAIVLMELLPNHDRWDITLVGTDINEGALHRAREGLYNDWSFRLVEPRLREQYFSAHKALWRIDDRVRRWVKFVSHNLVQDPFPNSQNHLWEMDLIICRNVFIYFDQPTIGRVLPKLHQTLRVGGYLMVGHTELYGQDLRAFKTRMLPESVVYQRRAGAIAPETMVASPTPPEIPARSPAAAPLPQQAARAPEPAPPGPSTLAQWIEKARALAHRGEHDLATAACQEALGLDPFALEPYYLLAAIAEEQGDRDGAKLFLKRVIYLDPEAVAAYLELSLIYGQEGDEGRSQKMKQLALEFLQRLPPETPVVNHEPLTAQDLLLALTQSSSSPAPE